MTSSATHSLHPCCLYCLEPLFPQKVASFLISQASAWISSQRGFRTVSSYVAYNPHHMSLSYWFSAQDLSLAAITLFIFCLPMPAHHWQGLVHCCVPRSKHGVGTQEMCIKFGLGERETPLGQQWKSQGDPGQARSSLCGTSNKELENQRTVGPSQGSSDLLCSQVSRWEPHLLWEAKGDSLTESSSLRL